MKQAKSFHQPKTFHQPKIKTYSAFEKELFLRKTAKFRRKYNLNLAKIDQDDFMVTNDLDAAIDEMTSSWEV